MKYLYDQVETNINDLVDSQVWWSNCATAEQIAAARNGKLELTLGLNNKPIPEDWIADVSGKKVLCLADAGGRQAPLLASAGSEVTVIDISQKMLDKDIQMAQIYALDIEIEHGNMTDLSRFKNETFNYIINPVSLIYVPSVHPVFKCRVTIDVRPRG